MKPRDIFLNRMKRQPTPRPAAGSATSIVTMDLMELAGVGFPEAHLNPEKMASLAEAGHTRLGFDNVMPLFSVWHESAALGCEVNWGARNQMPYGRAPLCNDLHTEIRIPSDLLSRPPCATPLKALSLLKKRLGNEVAVIGKVFGPWTLGYHVFGVENFLIGTITEPDTIRRVLRNLMEVTVQFGRAQFEAGADALTLADHCTRDLCSPATYREFLLELHRELKSRLGGPILLHICGDTSDRIPFIAETGIECFHFDSKVPSARARELAGDRLALMGGTSNFTIVQKGTPETIAEEVRKKLSHQIDILGPECAVPLDAPYQNLMLLAKETKAGR